MPVLYNKYLIVAMGSLARLFPHSTAYAPCISRDSDLAKCSYQSNQFNQNLSWQHTLCIGGPSAYRREGPTPRQRERVQPHEGRQRRRGQPHEGRKGGGANPTKGAKRGGANPTMDAKGGGHYRFCNLNHLLIAICTLR